GERVGERERHALVLRDRRAKSLALPRPGCRLVQEPDRCAAAACGDEEALDEDPFLRARLTARLDAVLVRDETVPQTELRMCIEVGMGEEAGRAGDLEPRRARLDEEEHLLAPGHRRDDVYAGPLAGDEPLLAVQQPTAGRAHGRGLQSREIRARSR